MPASPSRFICWSPNPNVMGVGVGLAVSLRHTQEHEVPMMGEVPLWEEETREPPPTCFYGKKGPMRTQQRRRLYTPGREPPQEPNMPAHGTWQYLEMRESPTHLSNRTCAIKVIVREGSGTSDGFWPLAFIEKWGREKSRGRTHFWLLARDRSQHLTRSRSGSCAAHSNPPNAKAPSDTSTGARALGRGRRSVSATPGHSHSLFPNMSWDQWLLRSWKIQESSWLGCLHSKHGLSCPDMHGVPWLLRSHADVVFFKCFQCTGYMT